MESPDISIKLPEGTFNLRVGTIILDAGDILMVRNEGADYCYTVGGRVRMGESAYEAAAREAMEETGLPLKADRLAYIHESFFIFEGDGRSYHEMAMFYLMKPLPGIRERLGESFNEPYGRVTFHWLPIDGLDKHRLYPEFFKTALLNPSHCVEHYVSRNGVTVRQ